MTAGRARWSVAVAVAGRPSTRDEDTPLLVAALASRSVRATVLAWDDPAARWDEHDLVVVRSTWDYVGRLGEFLEWASSVPRLANPAEVLSWNTDKRYLVDLERAGVAVVPTVWVAPGVKWQLPPGEIVVKPAVGNGARGAARFETWADGALEHIAGIHATGTVAMVQPFVSSLTSRPETGVVVLGGQVSHAIAKPFQLGSEPAGEARHRGIVRTEPSDAELDLAARALEVVPGGARRLLYARVDMVAGPDGAPLVMELEVTEPSLFLPLAPGSADRLAAAVVDRLEGAPSRDRVGPR